MKYLFSIVGLVFVFSAVAQNQGEDSAGLGKPVQVISPGDSTDGDFTEPLPADSGVRDKGLPTSGGSPAGLPTDSGVRGERLPTSGDPTEPLPADRKKDVPAFEWVRGPDPDLEPELDTGKNSDTDIPSLKGTATGPLGSVSLSGLPSACEIPEGVNVLHVPVQSWTENAEFMKKKQKFLKKMKDNTQSTVDFFRQGANRLLDHFVKKDEEPATESASTGAQNVAQLQESEETVFLPKVSEIVEKRAYAHFRLMEIITANPQAVVFHEFTTQVVDSRMLGDLDYASSVESGIERPEQLPDIESRTQEHLFQLVNSQFVNGIPQTFNELNKEQKETLAIVGGVHTLFFLYELPVIFPALPYVEYIYLLKHLDLSKRELELCQVLNVAHICQPLSDSIHRKPFIRAFKARALAKPVKGFLTYFPMFFSEEFSSPVDFEFSINPSIILAYGGEIESDSLFEDSGVKQGDDDKPSQIEQALNNIPNKDLKSYFVSPDNFYRWPVPCLYQ